LIDAWEKAAAFNPDGVFVESDQITNALHAVERVGSPPSPSKKDAPASGSLRVGGERVYMFFTI
jgi:hypothetical protein